MIEKIKIIEKKLLSDNWYILNKVTYEGEKDGEKVTQIREVYDRGNGSTILLYNKEKKSVILTKQFRIPTYLNGNKSGMLIEACAGLIEEENPIDCIIRETQEETGYEISNAKKIFEAYMSPGSVTEILHFFIAEYVPSMKTSEGGGLAEEQEDIEVLEVPFDKSLKMIEDGEIKDAKTIMLIQYLRLNKIL